MQFCKIKPWLGRFAQHMLVAHTSHHDENLSQSWRRERKVFLIKALSYAKQIRMNKVMLKNIGNYPKDDPPIKR